MSVAPVVSTEFLDRARKPSMRQDFEAGRPPAKIRDRKARG
jgi:hypothetical protein